MVVINNALIMSLAASAAAQVVANGQIVKEKVLARPAPHRSQVPPPLSPIKVTINRELSARRRAEVAHVDLSVQTSVHATRDAATAEVAAHIEDLRQLVIAAGVAAGDDAIPASGESLGSMHWRAAALDAWDEMGGMYDADEELAGGDDDDDGADVAAGLSEKARKQQAGKWRADGRVRAKITNTQTLANVQERLRAFDHGRIDFVEWYLSDETRAGAHRELRQQAVTETCRVDEEYAEMFGGSTVRVLEFEEVETRTDREEPLWWAMNDDLADVPLLEEIMVARCSVEVS